MGCLIHFGAPFSVDVRREVLMVMKPIRGFLVVALCSVVV
jgi:hypothetical protein